MIRQLIEKLAEQYPDSNHRLTVEDFASWLSKNAAPAVERQEPAYQLPEHARGDKWYGFGYCDFSSGEEKSRLIDYLKELLDDVPEELLYTSPPAPVAVDDSTTSDKYRAELYDEVWQKARDMGFANVTDALERLDNIDGCPRLDNVKEMNR